MIKIAVAIIVVALLGYLGYGIERYYKKRIRILDDYQNFIRFVKRETEFLKSDLIELVKRYDYTTNELKETLNDIIDKTDVKQTFLGARIVKEIDAFLGELSKADYYFKNQVIKNAEEIAENLLKQAKQDKTQKGELSRKLLILLGIGLIIIIL